MLAVIISWVVLGFLFWSYGHAIYHWLGQQQASFSAKLLAGLILLAFLFTCGAFFTSTQVLGSLAFAVALGLGLYFRKHLFSDLIKIKALLKSPLWLTIFFLTAFVSSQSPTIFDHYSYYWQTVAWFNEHGTVTGLANLHPFFGQASTWHILQSGLNFSQLGFNLHTLNGFLVLLVVLYFLEQKEVGSLHFTANYMLVLPLVLLFVDAASTDLPSLVLVPLIIHAFFTRQFSKRQVFYILFLIMVKVSVAPLLLLVLGVKSPLKLIKFTLLPGLFLGGLWLFKNYIISGYLLFPIAWSPLAPEWQMNADILNFLMSKRAGYSQHYLPILEYDLLDLLGQWFQMSGIHRLMNWSMLGLCLWVPFTSNFRRYAKLRYLYFTLLLMFVFVLLTSPQYRFFLVVWMCFLVVVLDDLRNLIPKKISASFLTVLIVVLCVPVLLLNVQKLQWRSQLSWVEIFVINSLDQLPARGYKTYQVGNLKFNSPKQTDNRYEVGQLALPAVNVDMLEVFQQYFSVNPQLRDSLDLGSGFIWKAQQPIKADLHK